MIDKRVSEFNKDLVYTIKIGRSEVEVRIMSRYGEEERKPYITHGSSWSGGSSETNVQDLQNMIEALTKANEIAQLHLNGSEYII